MRNRSREGWRKDPGIGDAGVGPPAGLRQAPPSQGRPQPDRVASEGETQSGGLSLESPSAVTGAGPTTRRRGVAPKTIRLRDKEHRKFVSRQPCLVCGRAPSDPHHLRFAQPQALGRKVSDEFTVPVCRVHHREIHRHGDEVAWWSRARINPVPVALELWRHTRKNGEIFPPDGNVEDGPTPLPVNSGNA